MLTTVYMERWENIMCDDVLYLYCRCFQLID